MTKKYDPKKLITDFDFCKIKSKDEKLKEDGFHNGDIVFVAGKNLLPIDKNDPYKMKYYMMIQRCDDEGNLLAEEGYFLVDPLSLKRVNRAQQERLTKKLEKKMQETLYAPEV